MIIPVILAGGVGSRLWPLSTKECPKQFLKLISNVDAVDDVESSELSMLQMTLVRLKGLDAFPPIIVCSENHRFLVAEHARQLNINLTAIILEPEGRGTASAIALAAFYVKHHLTGKGHFIDQRPGDEELTLLVLPADHFIQSTEQFQEAVNQGYLNVKGTNIVSFGVAIGHAETGFGYIKQGKCIEGPNIHEVEGFTEKPNLELSQIYKESGNYLWNSGIVMLTAAHYLDLLQALQPTLYSACGLAMDESNQQMDFVTIDKKAFTDSPNLSVDVAIMEAIFDTRLELKDRKVLVIKLDSVWCDMGTFNAIWKHSEKDKNNNVIKGVAKTVISTDTLIINEGKCLTTFGVDNLVIVNTGDNLFIANKDRLGELTSSSYRLLNSDEK